MARGRIISPDFWTDGKMISLSPFARLFYIGMWNFATCDRGHLPDDALGLKLKILPADPVDAGELLEELMGAGRVVRLELGSETSLRIPTFERHQSGSRDARWKTRCATCRLMETLESFEESPRALANSRDHVVEGKRVRREGEPPSDPSPFCASHPAGTDGPCRACGDARRAFEAHAKVAAPTVSGIVTEPMCPLHEGYPHPDSRWGCPRCREVSGAAA